MHPSLSIASLRVAILSYTLCRGFFDSIDEPIRYVLIQQLEVFLPHVSDHLAIIVRLEGFWDTGGWVLTFPQEKQRTGMIITASTILMIEEKETVVCASTIKRKGRLSVGWGD